MRKNNKKDNTLIKRKRLVLILKEKGVKRVNVNALVFLERHIEKEIEIIAELLNEEIIIKGKKTLEKEDVRSVLEKLRKEEASWEI